LTLSLAFPFQIINFPHSHPCSLLILRSGPILRPLPPKEHTSMDTHPPYQIHSFMSLSMSSVHTYHPRIFCSRPRHFGPPTTDYFLSLHGQGSDLSVPVFPSLFEFRDVHGGFSGRKTDNGPHSEIVSHSPILFNAIPR